MGPGGLREEELLRRRVPPAGRVAEVNTGLQKRLHGYSGRQTALLCVEKCPQASISGTGNDEQGRRPSLLRGDNVPAIFDSGAAREGGFLYAGGREKLPIYEYRCSKGHQYERAEGFDAPSEQRCPSCSGRSRRQISLPAVIFKGSGFYSPGNRKAPFG